MLLDNKKCLRDQALTKYYLTKSARTKNITLISFAPAIPQ